MKKYLICIIFSSICFIPCFVLDAESRCVEGDCITGQGTFTLSNGGKYAGEWKVGKKQGRGVEEI